jgi:hypothetical protein
MSKVRIIALYILHRDGVRMRTGAGCTSTRASRSPSRTR